MSLTKSIALHRSKSTFEWPILYTFERKLRQKIVDFAVLQNGCNAFIITSNDEVHCIGHNGIHAPLPIGTTSRALKGVQISELSGQGICGILGGNDTHVVALTDSGDVYSWGNNKYFVINEKDEFVKLPQLLSLPSSVAMVVIGLQHTVILTKGGLIYSWGDNSEGQLGIGDNVSATSGPTLVIPQPNQSLNCIYIGSGLFTSYFVLSDGNLYAAGSGKYGALGNKSTDNAMLPVLVSLPVETRMVIASKYSGYAITSRNDLYSWGCNNKGQLGNGELDNELIPRFVGKFLDVATHFDCDTAAGIHAVGSIYVWGATRFGIITQPTLTCLTTLTDTFTVYINSRTYNVPSNIVANQIGGRRRGARTIEEVDKPVETSPPALDFTIWIGYRGNETHKVMVHQETLYKRSYFFKSLFLNKLISRDTREVVLPELSFDIICTYLDYMDSGVINNSLVTDQDVNDLFHFAWSYREWNLVFYLIEKYHYTYQLPYEYDPLTVDNVCFAYEDGLIAKDKILCDNCIVFIANNLQEVLMSDHFLYDIKCSTIQSIMQALAEKHLLNGYDAIVNTFQGRSEEDCVCLLKYPDEIMYPKSVDGSEVINEICDGQLTEDEVNATVRDISATAAIKKRKGIISSKAKTRNCVYLAPPEIAYAFWQFNKIEYLFT